MHSEFPASLLTLTLGACHADLAGRRSPTRTKVEIEVGSLFPRKDWTMLSHQMIFHGRRCCFARRPAYVARARSRNGALPTEKARLIRRSQQR